MQSPGTYPDVVEIVVEIPRGSRNKYEFDEEVGVFRLDRVLSSAVFYNFDYGFIEGTRAGDGDHTDALLIIDEPTFTGCHVWARPIGGLEMRDEKGFDFKVLCVALGDAHQQHIERLEQVRPHRLVEIEQFFNTYKALEDKAVDVVGWRDQEAALQVLRDDRATWIREVEGAAARRQSFARPTTRRGRARGRRRAALSPSRERRGDPYAGMPGRRLFVAVPLPDDAAEAVRSVVDEVRAEALPDGARDVRWVRLDGLHLTLRFLGPTAEERIEPTAAAVRAVASAAPGPIDLELGGAGTFPTARAASSAVDRGRRGHRGARPAIEPSSTKRWSPRAGSPTIDRSGPTSRWLDRTGSRPVRSSPIGCPRPWPIVGSRHALTCSACSRASPAAVPLDMSP